ncbi:hypothetical protein HD554DRAFT_2082909 [Boletus coccyginus]|nr:hypothetical protein HD554DRAFT_2082909 [Boletus coccyginus]
MIPFASIIPSGFASHALQLLRRVQHGASPVELIYTTHEHWPFRPGHTVHTRPTLRIAVLDSSFNPPTLAHLALANSPPPVSPQPSPATSAEAEPYDARILLLSIRNADKAFKPGDATFVQRLEMMRLLSHDIQSSIDTAESSDESSQMSDNVAVAIIDEPTFVGKSTLLLRFLRTRLATVVESSNSPNSISNRRDVSYPFPSPKLTFLLGLDTLIRLFSPKYYPSEQCAYRRGASADKMFQETPDKTLEVVHEFLTSDRITFIHIGIEEETYSSSEVRAKVAAGDEKWKWLVTDAIASYIVDRGIYSASEREQ